MNKKTLEYFNLPNGLVVSFRSSDHKYFVNGKEVPSVSELLNRKFGSKYGNVRPEILKAASDYGTEVHRQLDEFIRKRREDPSCPIDSEFDEVKGYFLYLEPLFKINPIITEKVVALYNKNNEVVACGRFDMLCYLNGKLTLVDFKTTSSIDRQHVSGQLNLYLTAAYQSGYIDNKNVDLGVIHLVGKKVRFVPMTRFADDYYLQFI